MITGNKIKGILLIGVFSLSTTFAATNASAYFADWGFDPDGAGAAPVVNITEYLDFISNGTLITNDWTTNTFTETGNFEVDRHDGVKFPDPTPAITATFSATGDLVGTTSFTFDSGIANLQVFDNGGTAIGTFDLLSGGGALDDSGLGAPNGIITANFSANSLLAGYWFAPDGTDLTAWTTTVGSPIITLGFATTNASLLQTPPPIYENPDGSGRLVTFGVSNNGQFRLDAVPEPATFVLFGFGLLGLAAYKRKK